MVEWYLRLCVLSLLQLDAVGPSVAKTSASQTVVNFIRGRSRQPKSSPIFRQAKMRPNVYFWAFLCGQLPKNHPIGRKTIAYPILEVEDNHLRWLHMTSYSYQLTINLLIDVEKASKSPWIDRKLTIFHKGARFQDISQPGSQK